MSETLGVSSRALLVIRVGLLLAAWGWGIAFAFVFSPWEVAAEQLEWMGAREMTYQPMLDYWMRMAGATFGCIGMAHLPQASQVTRFHLHVLRLQVYLSAFALPVLRRRRIKLGRFSFHQLLGQEGQAVFFFQRLYEFNRQHLLPV